LFVEGRLSFDSWTAQDGTKRSKHRVTVENFQFLGSAPGASDKSDIRDGAVSYDKSNTQAATDKVTDDIPF
jgi:single-stranded DNA-binding protein